MAELGPQTTDGQSFKFSPAGSLVVQEESKQEGANNTHSTYMPTVLSFVANHGSRVEMIDHT
jgi:hypothetical protein